MLDYSKHCRIYRQNKYLFNCLIFPKIKILSTELLAVYIYGFPLDGKYKATLGTARTDATQKENFYLFKEKFKDVLTKVLHEALKV